MRRHRRPAPCLLPALLLACLPLAASAAEPAAATESAAEPTLELAWETAGFSAPESVVFDPQAQRYYVSNMGSWGEGATPGDGFISVLDADGALQTLRWIEGLENPKGLALANGRLYVGDDDALVEIDPAAAAILARHRPDDGPGAFNDATADADGNVYVFSRRLDTVFRLANGGFAPWRTLDPHETGRPNGLRVDAGRLLTGSWEVPAADGGQAQPGHLSAIDLAQGRIERVPGPTGHIDGIEPDDAGGLTLTDWTRGEVLHVDAHGNTRLLLRPGKGSADHLYRADARLLVVPQLLDDVVRAWRWNPAAAD
ncbi:MAG TPA: hypothetical protein VK000_03115 [Luteimonas sp.]|nr:hypothetical protein [Luteimonas sp.]